MISLVALNGLELKKDEQDQSHRSYYVYRGDDVILSKAHFKEAVDCLYYHTAEASQPTVEALTGLGHRLPESIQAVFLCDVNNEKAPVAISRTEAEQVFKEEENCLPKVGSSIFMSVENSQTVEEKWIASIEMNNGTLFVYLEGRS